MVPATGFRIEGEEPAATGEVAHRLPGSDAEDSLSLLAVVKRPKMLLPRGS